MVRTGVIIFFLVFSTIEAGVGTKEFKNSAPNSGLKSNNKNTLHKFHKFHKTIKRNPKTKNRKKSNRPKYSHQQIHLVL